MTCNRWSCKGTSTMFFRLDPLCSDPFLRRQSTPSAPWPSADGEKWLVGLDLGQAQDFTAMVTLHRTTVETETESYRAYACPHIKRWPLGTTYPAIVADL